MKALHQQYQALGIEKIGYEAFVQKLKSCTPAELEALLNRISGHMDALGSAPGFNVQST